MYTNLHNLCRYKIKAIPEGFSSTSYIKHLAVSGLSSVSARIKSTCNLTGKCFEMPNVSFTKPKDYKRIGQRGVMVGVTTMGHMISVIINTIFSKFPLPQFTAEGILIKSSA
jgi:hypothetical protein